MRVLRMCGCFAVSPSSADSATAPYRPSKPCGGRFKGFGHDKPLPEQTAVIETLAKLETAGARQLLAEIAHDLPSPLLPAALSAALSASLRLPVHVLRPLLADADPRIRELAARLSGFGQPDIGALEACLGDTQPAVRRAAAIVLGQFGHAAAKVTLLNELRRAPTGDIVEALSAIADDDIVVHLGRCAAAHPAAGRPDRGGTGRDGDGPVPQGCPAHSR